MGPSHNRGLCQPPPFWSGLVSNKQNLFSFFAVEHASGKKGHFWIGRKEVVSRWLLLIRRAQGLSKQTFFWGKTQWVNRRFETATCHQAGNFSVALILHSGLCLYVCSVSYSCTCVCVCAKYWTLPQSHTSHAVLEWGSKSKEQQRKHCTSTVVGNTAQQIISVCHCSKWPADCL